MKKSVTLIKFIILFLSIGYPLLCQDSKDFSKKLELIKKINSINFSIDFKYSSGYYFYNSPETNTVSNISHDISYSKRINSLIVDIYFKEEGSYVFQGILLGVDILDDLDTGKKIVSTNYSWESTLSGQIYKIGYQLNIRKYKTIV